jgi:hypothetical protein
MKYSFQIIIFILLASANVFSQADLTKIIMDFHYDEGTNYFGYDLKSDTLNTYILLGADFKNDVVAIYVNDSLIYNKRAETDYGYSYADIIKIPNSGDILFSLNGMTRVQLYRRPYKHYITINFYRYELELLINYSKYLPSIY